MNPHYTTHSSPRSIVPVATYDVDTSHWPMVVLTTTGKPSDEALEAHLREIEDQVLSRREHFVVVVDRRHAEALDARQRAIVAAHRQTMASTYSEYCRGEAYVADTHFQSIGSTAFWHTRPSCPYGFFEHLDGARQWALARLREASPRQLSA